MPPIDRISSLCLNSLMRQNKSFAIDIKIKAACGHEYKARFYYNDEQDLREQCSIFTRFDCADCHLKKPPPKISNPKQP